MGRNWAKCNSPYEFCADFTINPAFSFRDETSCQTERQVRKIYSSRIIYIQGVSFITAPSRGNFITGNEATAGT